MYEVVMEMNARQLSVETRVDAIEDNLRSLQVGYMYSVSFAPDPYQVYLLELGNLWNIDEYLLNRKLNYA